MARDAQPPSDAPDEALVARSLAGEREAFAVLVGRYRGFVFSLIHARLTCAEDVEDETQETFATAFRRLSMLRDAAQFRPWLARIAVNQASSRVRANARRADTPSDLRPADLAWGWSYQLPWLLARCIVTRAVDALSDAEADAVRMRCIDGSSFREIGVRVGISGNAAEKRVKQAVRRLRSRCLHAH